MNTKILAAAAAAFVALTSVASADTFYVDSQRDAQLKAQAARVDGNGGYVTSPVIDSVNSERDLQLQAQSQSDGAALMTTHGARQVFVTTPAIDPVGTD